MKLTEARKKALASMIRSRVQAYHLDSLHLVRRIEGREELYRLRSELQSSLYHSILEVMERDQRHTGTVRQVQRGQDQANP